MAKVKVKMLQVDGTTVEVKATKMSENMAAAEYNGYQLIIHRPTGMAVHTRELSLVKQAAACQQAELLGFNWDATDPADFNPKDLSTLGHESVLVSVLEGRKTAAEVLRDLLVAGL